VSTDRPILHVFWELAHGLKLLSHFWVWRCIHLQIKDGSREALAPCGEEFRHIAKKFRDIAYKVIDGAYSTDAMRNAHQPYFCYDNARIHSAADDIIPPDSRVPHSPRSPDMNKPIEHQFGRLETILKKTDVLRAIAADHQVCHFSLDFWPKLVYAYMLEYDLQAVRRDIESLFDTYQWIVQHGGLPAPSGLN